MADALQPDLSSYNNYANTNRLLSAAGNGPQNASGWLGVAQQQQGLQQGQVQLSTQEFNLANGRIAALNNIAASIMADPSADNLTQRLSDATQAGTIPPDMAAQALAQTSGMNDQQRQQWAFQHSQMLADYSQKIHAAYGASGLIDNGQTITPVVTREGPQAGTYAAGGSPMQRYMAPGEASAPADYTDPATGRTVQTTLRGRNQAVGDTAGLPPTMGAAAPAPQPAPGYTGGPTSGVGNPSSYVNPARAATAGVSIVNGRPVYGPAPSAAPTPSGMPQAAAGPQPGAVISPGPVGGRAGSSSQGPTVAGPGMTAGAPLAPQGGAPQPAVPGLAGPAPGLTDAAKITGAASAEQGVNLQKAADGAPIRKAMLANLNDDLDHFTSGPGADWQQVGKAWANRNVLPTSMQFDPQSIASQESFNKQATQLAQQQFQALGGTGTDSQLSSTFKANPNQALSQLGNRQIIQLLRGNEDALQAKAAAWQQWQQQNGSNTYGQFQQDFNKTYNPRVYQAMYMDPTQIADMRKNMSPAEQQQFAKDYTALKAKGYIMPGGAGAQQ